MTAPIHTIVRDGVYTFDAVSELLGLPRNTPRRAARLGRLRCSRIGNQFVILGSWVLEWVEASSRRSRKRKPALNGHATDN